MSIKNQIESLRQQFWSGDASARQTLRTVLQADLPVIVRRATSSRGSQTPIGRLVRLLMNDGENSCDPGVPQQSHDFASLAAKLCDVLLNRQFVPAHLARPRDTGRFVAQTVAVR